MLARVEPDLQLAALEPEIIQLAPIERLPERAICDAGDGDDLGDEIPAPGEANMSMSTTQLAERYGCVSMTLEMPFKDNFDLPDEVFGWSPARSKFLAYACLDALHAILPELKAATSERGRAKSEKVPA
jgi:hypothetical protein